MPLTPVFSLSQDDVFVYIKIRVPYVRVSDLEYVIDDCDISFYCKPYLLKLTLPFAILDNDTTRAVYDVNQDNGTITMHLTKETRGLHFPNLDLITTLQQPKMRTTLYGQQSTTASHKQTNGAEAVDYGSLEYLQREHELLDQMCAPKVTGKPLIEVIESTTFDGQAEEITPTQPETERKTAEETSSTSNLADLLSNASLSDDIDSISLSTQVVYGFDNNMSNFFRDIGNEFPELIDLQSPDDTPASQRKELRESDEDMKFDEDRFVQDMIGGDEDPMFEVCMGWIPPWRAPFESFTDDEQEAMRRLPNYEYLKFSEMELTRVFCMYLDILIAYAYDCRMTQGEWNVESAWTIRILSSTLSWLDVFYDPQDVMTASLHRLVTFPYLRRIDLATTCINDAINIIRNGKRAILRCMMTIAKIFTTSDQYYLLHRLYLCDMCVWIQKADDSELESFAKRLDFHDDSTLGRYRWDLLQLFQNVE